LSSHVVISKSASAYLEVVIRKRTPLCMIQSDLPSDSALTSSNQGHIYCLAFEGSHHDGDPYH
jgi:hypothetical protein